MLDLLGSHVKQVPLVGVARIWEGASILARRCWVRSSSTEFLRLAGGLACGQLLSMGDAPVVVLIWAPRSPRASA